MFLVLGLVPSAWLLRRMPVGFFFMFGGWLAILGGIALPLTVAICWRRWTPMRRRTVYGIGGALILGLILLAMIPLARADAQGRHPAVSDEVVRLAALATQVALAVWSVSAERGGGVRARRRDVFAYTSIIFAITLGVFVGRRTPAWVVVPIVALVAVRFAWLPTPAGGDANPRGRGGVATALLFTWTVAVLALQTQLLATLGGLAATTAAFGIGMVLLLVLSHSAAEAPMRSLGAGVAGFVVVMFAFVFLMPSLAGGKYLLQVGLRQVPMATTGTTVNNGQVTRWYSTDMTHRQAQSAIAQSFRSPPVSVWMSADGSSTTGLLFGYRLEARYYAQGQRIGTSSPCSTELRSCVGVAVRRSSD